MDRPGAPADPDSGGGVTPPAAFFGLWPKFAAAPEDLAVDEPQFLAVPSARVVAGDRVYGKMV